MKAIKRLVEADALKMEIIPNPKVRVKRYENLFPSEPLHELNNLYDF